MVKFLGNNFDQFRQNEQYQNCSMMIPDNNPSLEELDPAILSCGLPAIVLGGQRNFARIRYTKAQLKAMNASPLSHLRPDIIDDPIMGRFFFWKKDRIAAMQPQLPRNEADEPHHQPIKNDDAQPPAQPAGVRSHDNDERPPRKFDFNNNQRNHHVIVKSYNNQQFYPARQQDSTADEEPEWFSGGPTSRLDTIELKGFDDDLNGDGDKADQKNTSGKRISFFDELSNYDVLHPNRKHQPATGRYTGNQHENDSESVATSNTGSPPPARSTPTKAMAEMSLDHHHKETKDGVNISNFEDFMKFDSMLNHSNGSNGGLTGSRFTKYFRKGAHDGRRQDNGSSHRSAALEMSKFGDRKPGRNGPQDETNSVQNWMQLFSQNTNLCNNLLAQQQQYLSQMLKKTQQSDVLKKMLHMNNAAQPPASNGQPPSRMPTPQELQLHTQSIMQTALLRKRIMDQYKMQGDRPIPAVQQLISSVHSNLQKKFTQGTGNPGQQGNFNAPGMNYNGARRQQNRDPRRRPSKPNQSGRDGRSDRNDPIAAPSTAAGNSDLSRWFSQELLAKATAGQLPKLNI